MEPEAPMATRKLINHNGDIGEAEVLKDFLLMGATVNSMTGADYGLDLHVQVPLKPQKYEQLEKSWFLSGRVAHIQVKNMTSGQNPSPPVGRVRGWISGSEIGTPTFVVILKEEGRFFVSPRDLKAILALWEDTHADKLSRDALRVPDDGTKPETPHSVTLSGSNTHVFRPQTFPWLLHLWTKYPGVMMRTDVQEWPEMHPSELPARGTQFINDILLAWVKSHYANTIPKLSKADIAERAVNDGTCVFENSDSMAGAMSLVQEGFHGMYPEEPKDSSKVESLGWEIINALGLAWRRNQYFPHSNLMTSYATSPHIGQALNEAQQLLRDVMKFHHHCRVIWKDPEAVSTPRTSPGTNTESNQATTDA